MARTGPIHHIGTFLLLAAWVLLLVVSISSPVVNDIALLKVSLGNSSTVSFGSFGYCVLDAATGNSNIQKTDWCSKSEIGYKPADIMSQIDGTNFNFAATHTADGLTNAFVLHPIACFVAFIAFLLSVGAGIFGSIFAAMVAFVAWVITLVVMAIDFASMGLIKHHVNDDGSGNHAKWASAVWMTLAAMLALFFGMFIILFTCLSARRANRSTKHRDEGIATNGTTTRRRRRFGF
jgi:hypothetical protein